MCVYRTTTRISGAFKSQKKVSDLEVKLQIVECCHVGSGNQQVLLNSKLSLKSLSPYCLQQGLSVNPELINSGLSGL